MPSKSTITLTGEDLKIEDIYNIVKNPQTQVAISSSAKKNVKNCRIFLEKEAKNKIIYGVNTGFGPMASYIIGKDNLEDLQKNLILGHAVGMGEPLKEEFVLAGMVVRLNTLIKGYSGVSYELVQLLCKFINHRIIPIVPEHGAVGTSGDLTQLAHIALALIGEGDVFYKGNRKATKTVLKQLKITPHVLRYKEGLALINGTSMMSGIAALSVVEAEGQLAIAVRNGGYALEVVNALSDSISEKLHSLRPHSGQEVVAKYLRVLTKSSKLLRSRASHIKAIELNHDVRKIDDHIQEVYSFRCIPQVLGPVYNTIKSSREVITVEINSVTDNPVVDIKKKEFIHGGNFHGDYIANTVDHLKIAIVKLSMLSERRINYLLHSALNEKFSPFLNLHKPGLSMGLQGLQFVATSTTAQNQSLAYPHNLHSIPTNADNQDIVSMGTDAALFLQKVLDNTYIILGIELLVLAQATDYSKNKSKLSESAQVLYKETRSIVPKIEKDRFIAKKLNKITEYLRNRNDNLFFK